MFSAPRSGRFRQPQFVDEAPQFLASVQAAFGVDVTQVVFDGLAADEQLGRDLRIGQALPDQEGHFCLPARQRQHQVAVSQGFLRAGTVFGAESSVPRTMSGMVSMPGMGWLRVMRSTM